MRLPGSHVALFGNSSHLLSSQQQKRKSSTLIAFQAFSSTSSLNHCKGQHLGAKFKLAQLEAYKEQQRKQQQPQRQQQPLASSTKMNEQQQQQRRRRKLSRNQRSQRHLTTRSLLLVKAIIKGTHNKRNNLLLIFITLVISVALQTSNALQVERNFPPDGGTTNSAHLVSQQHQFSTTLDEQRNQQQQHYLLSSSESRVLEKSQQVPEQLPIVVSSSDNSYVSASPPLSESASSLSLPVIHHRQHHHKHLLPKRNVLSLRKRLNTWPHQPVNNRQQQQQQQQQEAELRQVMPRRFQQHLPRKPEEAPLEPTSRADIIATTATTTQRHKFGQRFDDELRDDDDDNSNDSDGDDDDDDDVEGDEVDADEFNEVDVNYNKEEQDSDTTNDDDDEDNDAVDRVDNLQLTSGNNNNNRVADLEQVSSSADQITSQFNVRSASIIKTRESLQLGATFINYTFVTNLNACLVECWITESCDTAIYQESPVDFNHHLPDLSLTNSLNSLSLAANAAATTTVSPINEDELNAVVQPPTMHNNHHHHHHHQHHSNQNHLHRYFQHNTRRPTTTTTTTHQRRRKRLRKVAEQNWLSQNEYNNDFIQHNHYYNKRGQQQQQVVGQTGAGFFICYLFECAKSDGFKCQFSAHNYYVSAVRGDAIRAKSAQLHSAPAQRATTILEQPGDTINISVPSTQRSHNYLEPISSSSSSSSIEQQCSPQSFRCSDNIRCINQLNRCDGIIHCQDGSDEWNCQQLAVIGLNQQVVASSELPLLISDSMMSSNLSSPSAANRQVFDGSSSSNYLIYSSGNDEMATEVPMSIATASSVVDEQINKEPTAQFRLINNSPSYHLDSSSSVSLAHSHQHQQQPHYSKIISHSSANRQPFNGGRQWHDTHLASIKIGQYENYAKGGFNSAVIAILFGIGATGMLIMIVSHKMRYIRQRLAYKGRRRSLVPDADYLINTMSI